VSATKYHRDEANVVDQPFFAAYVHYLGYDIMKCSSSSYDATTWTFLVPEFDFEIMRQEFDSDQPILVRSYAAALKQVFAFQKLARESCGEHASHAWREAIRK